MGNCLYSSSVMMTLPVAGAQVSVSYCANVTDAGVAALAAACPQLEVLRLDELSKVTDIGVAAIAASCKRLRVRSPFGVLAQHRRGSGMDLLRPQYLLYPTL